MHELAITQGVVDAVTARTGTARVAAVTVRVGRLSGVVPDAMRFCFDLVTESTPLAGARLEVEQSTACVPAPRPSWTPLTAG